MNRKKSKLIGAQVEKISIEWLKGLLPEEEAEKITRKNYKSMLPKQTHILSKRQWKLSAFTERWFKQKIKKVLKRNPTKDISSITKDELNV
tara:strand:- start:2002 stop:2274 length:273 start_codon:yes stop_codon:yes gene_type:complete